MKFDFTTIHNRTGTGAVAADGLGSGGTAPQPPKDGWSAIPMWVADMNFATCPAIPAAIIKRAEQDLYGYFYPVDAYYDAIIQWQSKRNGVHDLTRDCIGYENGVLGGVVSAMNILCPRGGNVLVHSPTYVGFTRSLINNGYNIIHSPLTPDENGIWRMDFADMEEKILTHNIHVMIFCSPHNPTGRVWERRELTAVADLCRKHDVYLISDEIWSDLILDSNKHIPMQSVSEDARNRTIALYAPSKTFNLAGLVGSYHIIFNKRLKDSMIKQSSLSHYNSMNIFSMHALIAAYSEEGEQWLDELHTVLSDNVNTALEFFRSIEGVTVARPQGTYMLFPDFTRWCAAHNCTLDELLKAGWDVGVAWQDGRGFHGPCHIRINLALPHTQLQDALDRLKKNVFIEP